MIWVGGFKSLQSVLAQFAFTDEPLTFSNLGESDSAQPRNPRTYLIPSRLNGSNHFY
jgi:hypothetical protein